MANHVSSPDVQLQAAPAEPGTARAPAPSERLLSLDTFRGFTMFWIVGGEALMIGLQHLGHNRVIHLIVH